MLHDIQYYQNIDPLLADNIAMNNVDFVTWNPVDTLSAIYLRAGLRARAISGLKFNSTDDFDKGNFLMNYVKNNKPYEELFTKYNIDKNQYPD